MSTGQPNDPRNQGMTRSYANPAKPTTNLEQRGHGDYSCMFCRKELNEGHILFHDTVGALCVFTGLPKQGQSLSGGFSACELHAQNAIEQAMRPFVHAMLRGRKYPKGWQVSAYAIELDKHGQPRLGKRLFVTREKLFEEYIGNQKLMTKDVQ
jgi:hypothetical protein